MFLNSFECNSFFLLKSQSKKDKKDIFSIATKLNLQLSVPKPIKIFNIPKEMKNKRFIVEIIALC